MASNLLAKRVAGLDTYLFSKAVHLRKQFSNEGKTLVDLSVGDPDVTIAKDLLREAFEHALKFRQNYRYPPNRGKESLRHAISAWMAFRFGARLDPETEIGVLGGSKEGLAHLAMTLYNSKDTILMGALTYPVYKRSASIAGAKVKFLPMPESESYRVSLNTRVRGKVLLINYPNNPTGATVDFHYYREVVGWAKKNNVFIISDLAYSEIFDESKVSPASIFEVPGAKDVAVEFHSFSKSFGLAGMRLAWVCGNPSILSALYGLKDTYDSGVSNFTQDVGEFILSDRRRDSELTRIRGVYSERKRLFEKGLKEAGIHRFSSPATFYVWAAAPREKYVELLLKKKNVLSVSGEGFGETGKNHVRFALCADQPILQEALKRIREFQ